MSIQSEITRINQNVSAAYSEIFAKGGTLPEVRNTDGLAEAINSIEGGSSAILSGPTRYTSTDKTETITRGIYSYSVASKNPTRIEVNPVLSGNKILIPALHWVEANSDIQQIDFSKCAGAEYLPSYSCQYSSVGPQAVSGIALLPDSIKYIGNYAFRGTPLLLYNTTQWDNIVDIGEYAFSSIQNDFILTSDLPVSLQSIGAHGFQASYMPSSIHIPSQCYIGNGAFNATTNLAVVYFEGKPSYIYSGNSTSSQPFYRSSVTDIYCAWSEGEVDGAPWGATNATIHYDYVPQPKEWEWGSEQQFATTDWFNGLADKIAQEGVNKNWVGLTKKLMLPEPFLGANQVKLQAIAAGEDSNDTVTFLISGFSERVEYDENRGTPQLSYWSDSILRSKCQEFEEILPVPKQYIRTLKKGSYNKNQELEFVDERLWCLSAVETGYPSQSGTLLPQGEFTYGCSEPYSFFDSYELPSISWLRSGGLVRSTTGDNAQGGLLVSATAKQIGAGYGGAYPLLICFAFGPSID